MNNKVVIIGTGNVGMSYAYALINQNSRVNEIVLIDINENKAQGEAMDLNHGIPFGPSNLNVRSGNYEDCRNAQIVCICAGANQNPGETRLDLIRKNVKVFTNVLDNIMANNFAGIFLIATNPVDIMTYFTAKHTNFPKNKVIGTGTTLDTARLRYLVGKKIDINSKNIHAYVIGEHGDSELVPWTSATVGLQKITDFISEAELEEIYVEVRDSAYKIIEAKGNTSYGIGMCMVKITNAILGNENSVLTVSNYDEKNDVYIGMPAILGKNGVKNKIFVNLTPKEQIKLQNSIDVIKEAMKNTNI